MSNIETLNSSLFATLERLANSSLKGDALAEEINRSKAITEVAKEIVSANKLGLEAAKLRAEYQGLKNGMIPKMLGQEV